jgi:release factor glutamine methyltransferase
MKFIELHKIENPKILDLGAGTGCIGISILKQIPKANLISVDISEIAIRNIKLNVEKFNLNDRITVVESPVEKLNWSELGPFDCIVSNPPYIDVNDTDVDIHVRKFEPATALFAENKGLLFLQDWSRLSLGNLKKPGLMVFEMGHLQGATMKEHFENLSAFSKVDIVQDLSKKDRIIKGII